MTSTHGIVHSLRPSKLLNHSSPTPAHSQPSCPSPVLSPVENRRWTSSTAAPANAFVVVFIASTTYPARPSVGNNDISDVVPWTLLTALALALAAPAALEALNTGESKSIGPADETKRGENQSPRRSKKHRSDQWHDDANRIRRRAEQ